jgi:hypothetical protein
MLAICHEWVVLHRMQCYAKTRKERESEETASREKRVSKDSNQLPCETREREKKAFVCGAIGDRKTKGANSDEREKPVNRFIGQSR